MSFSNDFGRLSLIVCGAFCLLVHFNYCLGLSKFTNVQCSILDANFSEISLCRLRAIRRDVNELSIKVKLLQKPSFDYTMRWQLMKKASGYKPFLYDVSADVCEYLDKRNHPFLNIIMNTLGNQSTLNRCPLKTELNLEHFGFPVKALEMMPLPYGEYALFSTFSAASVERASVKIYFLLAEF